jgi:hypothetical protein
MPNTADLLEEIATLKAMLTAADARDKRKDERIARLEKLVAAFKQAAFGRKSEKSDPDQFELALEDLETAMAVIHAEEDAEDRAAKRPAKPRASNRGSLPKHLPRIEEVIEPDSHAHRHRPRPQAETDQRSAPMELRHHGVIGTPLTNYWLRGLDLNRRRIRRPFGS